MSRRAVLQPPCNDAEVCERFDWQLVIVGGVEEVRSKEVRSKEMRRWPKAL
jgi:hypothetical protein